MKRFIAVFSCVSVLMLISGFWLISSHHYLIALAPYLIEGIFVCVLVINMDMMDEDNILGVGISFALWPLWIVVGLFAGIWIAIELVQDFCTSD